MRNGKNNFLRKSPPYLAYMSFLGIPSGKSKTELPSNFSQGLFKGKGRINQRKSYLVLLRYEHRALYRYRKVPRTTHITMSYQVVHFKVHSKG